MSGQLQLRRGSTAENDAFTGVEGELTYDTVKKELRLHDGVTQGGNKVPVLVAVQRPTAENNYTWYRKWSDGWVEQGGQHTLPSNIYNTVNLAVTMADNNYFVSATYKDVAASDSSIRGINTGGYTTTSFMTKVGVNGANYVVVWEVKGMAAE